MPSFCLPRADPTIDNKHDWKQHENRKDCLHRPKPRFKWLQFPPPSARQMEQEHQINDPIPAVD